MTHNPGPVSIQLDTSNLLLKVTDMGCTDTPGRNGPTVERGCIVQVEQSF